MNIGNLVKKAREKVDQMKDQYSSLWGAHSKRLPEMDVTESQRAILEEDQTQILLYGRQGESKSDLGIYLFLKRIEELEGHGSALAIGCFLTGLRERFNEFFSHHKMGVVIPPTSSEFRWAGVKIRLYGSENIRQFQKTREVYQDVLYVEDAALVSFREETFREAISSVRSPNGKKLRCIVSTVSSKPDHWLKNYRDVNDWHCYPFTSIEARYK